MTARWCSGVATIFGPPRKLLVWASGQEVTATNFFLEGPCRALSASRAPPRSRGLRGSRYATAVVVMLSTSLVDCLMHLLWIVWCAGRWHEVDDRESTMNWIIDYMHLNDNGQYANLNSPWGHCVVMAAIAWIRILLKNNTGWRSHLI